MKFGACNIGIDILGSNENAIADCQFEVCGDGVRIEAVLAGDSDHNSMIACRFESNTTSAWTIANAGVRDTEIIAPKPFGTYTYTDNGTRTLHLTSGNQSPPPASRRSILTRSGSYTLLPTDDVVIFTGASATATLPAASAAGAGRLYTLKNLNASSLTVTVASGGGNIDNSVSAQIAQYGVGRYISNGTTWWAI